MTTDQRDTVVRHEIEVGVSTERAFQVFTQRFDAIKPRDHNLLPVEIAETVMEPWSGGRLYDRGVDGSTCEWGRMTEIDPPHRLQFRWAVTPQWQIEPDPARCSEVEVRFEPVGSGRTRVVIEHRHLDRHGPGWEGERDAVAGEHGWPLYTSGFRALVG